MIRCIVFTSFQPAGVDPTTEIETMSRVESYAAKLVARLFSLPKRSAFLKSMVMSGE